MKRFAILTICSLAGTLAFAQSKQLKPKSAKEGQAINAMLTAQDPDTRIKAASDLINNFADTDFKSFALYMEAVSYQDKNDSDKTIVYGEQALDVDPKNYQAAVLVAKTYTSITKPNDLDKEEKLTKASKDAQQALELIKTADKPNPSVTDAQWTEVKNDLQGQAYLALGAVAAYHNKMDEVTADFQKVADLDTDPIDLIRAGRFLIDTKKPDQALIWIDKAINSPNGTAQSKSIAANDKIRAQGMIKK